MEHNDSFYLAVLAVMFLMFLSAYVTVYIKKIRLPYTVALVILGILLSLLSHLEVFQFLNALELSPNLIFYIFLPILIFEGSYNIKFFELQESIKTVSALAVITLIISTFFIGFGLSLLFPLIGLTVPFLTLLLFGALISATDPIAALAIFKELGVPNRLRLLLEGESIFNDGTALVLFQVIFAIITGGAFAYSQIPLAIWQFVFLVAGGAILGAILGIIFSKLIEAIQNLAVVEITLTIILAHTTFIVAEKFLHVSGIIAVSVAGMVIGNYGRYKISPPVREFMEKFWGYGAFLANSLIFLLIGLSMRQIDFTKYVWPILITLAVVFVARYVSIYGLIPFTNRWLKEEKVRNSWQFILSWGGLRGALPLAIVLLLPSDFPQRELLLVLTIAVIFFTLIIQAPTLTRFLKWFRLQNLTSVQLFSQEESLTLIQSAVCRYLAGVYERKHISEKAYKRLCQFYQDLQQESQKRFDDFIAKHGDSLTFNDKLFILRKHLLGIERQTYGRVIMTQH